MERYGKNVDKFNLLIHTLAVGQKYQVRPDSGLITQKMSKVNIVCMSLKPMRAIFFILKNG